MAIKHNQKLISTHLRKDWQRRVRCHFDQPGAKVRRRDARRAKAAAVAPRPVDLLRPIVRCPTVKHNRRARAGRGFSLEELKAAGVPRLYAPTIGIAVDHRRQNISEESLAANVARLKEYLARVIVLPRRSNAPKKGDTKADLSKVDLVSSLASAIPIVSSDKTIKEISKADLPKAIEGGAFRKLRLARSDARLAGVREKRIRDKAEAEAAKK